MRTLLPNEYVCVALASGGGGAKLSPQEEQGETNQ
jgi:hypothetical protein